MAFYGPLIIIIVGGVAHELTSNYQGNIHVNYILNSIQILLISTFLSALTLNDRVTMFLIFLSCCQTLNAKMHVTKTEIEIIEFRE